MASTVGDYSLLIVLNADHQLQPVQIPAPDGAKQWYPMIDTSLASGEDCLNVGAEIRLDPANVYIVNPTSIVVLLSK